MIIDLSGKTAIVTGSTGGIGLAIATDSARAGVQITVVGRDQSRVNTAVEKVKVDGLGIYAVSKSAMQVLSGGLAQVLAGTGVTVNWLCF